MYWLAQFAGKTESKKIIQSMRVPRLIRSYIIAPSDPAMTTNKKTARSSARVYMQRLLAWLSSFEYFVKLQQVFQNIMINVVAVGPVPRHVSFIMDGNRRYAKKMGMPLKKGHEAGGITLLSLCYVLKKMGVRCVSAYAFSIENFNRPAEEVDALTNMFSVKLDEFARRAKDYKDPLYQSKLRIVGDHSLISEDMRKKIKEVEQLTSDGEDFTLYICFPYTARNDIHHSMQSSIELWTKSNLDLRQLKISDFTSNMYLDQYSDKCDLLIRTSGHLRLSDYMLWQVHENATIKFSPALWPDFGFLDLYLMMLHWSFFTTIQKFKKSTMQKTPLRFWNRKHSSKCCFELLPTAPIAISITGEHE